MNRQQRRAAAKQARSESRGLSKVIAIHEAGHAVARYIMADPLGFKPDEAIDCIEIAFAPTPRQSLDGNAVLSSSAVTFGPMYSMAMVDFLRDHPVPQGLGPGHPLTVAAEIDACKSGGVDVERWAVAKAVICMAGAAAEAKFIGRPLSEVANGYECENDLGDAVRHCLWIGMSSDEASNVANNALDHAERIFAEPLPWQAVLALANSLPASGRVPGK